MKHRAFLLATPVARIRERWGTDDGGGGRVADMLAEVTE